MRRTLALHTRPDTDGGDAVEGINRKNRHVVAIALAINADVIATNDRRLRREIDALGRHLRATTADDFAVGFLGDDPDAIERVLDDLITNPAACDARVRQLATRNELLDQLARAFQSFVAAIDPNR